MTIVIIIIIIKNRKALRDSGPKVIKNLANKGPTTPKKLNGER